MVVISNRVLYPQVRMGENWGEAKTYSFKEEGSAVEKAEPCRTTLGCNTTPFLPMRGVQEANERDGWLFSGVSTATYQ
jgi:hypothetical protein